MPLDLHVLSLPLAFILSQDQTLHCNKFLSTIADEPACVTYSPSGKSGSKPNSCLSLTPRFLILRIVRLLNLLSVSDHKLLSQVICRSAINFQSFKERFVFPCGRTMWFCNLSFHYDSEILLNFSPLFHFGSAKVIAVSSLCKRSRKLFYFFSFDPFLLSSFQKGFKGNSRNF